MVLAALREDPTARQGDPQATERVVMQATRHVLATTLTTIIGFVPLMLDPTGFWPPLAVAIAGGLSGATLLALYYIPAAHLLMSRRRGISPRSTQQLPATPLPDYTGTSPT